MPFGSKINNRYYNSKVTNKKKKTCIGTVIYHKIPETTEDIVVRTVFGDRFDLLAEKYYGDASLWWYLAKANDKYFNSLEPNELIRIPHSTTYAKEI